VVIGGHSVVDLVVINGHWWLIRLSLVVDLVVINGHWWLIRLSLVVIRWLIWWPLMVIGG
jgi:hypothetical protein